MEGLIRLIQPDSLSSFRTLVAFSNESDYCVFEGWFLDYISRVGAKRSVRAATAIYLANHRWLSKYLWLVSVPSFPPLCSWLSHTVQLAWYTRLPLKYVQLYVIRTLSLPINSVEYASYSRKTPSLPNPRPSSTFNPTGTLIFLIVRFISRPVPYFDCGVF